MPAKLRERWPVLLLLALFLFAALLCNKWGTQTQTDLERRLSGVLSSVRGAGDVHVLIHTQPAQESVYAFSGFQKESEEIVGVLIVAQGADNAAVALRLAQAAGAALNIDQSRIEVYPMETEKS